MGGTCGTDCQSLKLSNNINMDSDVRRNRANSKQSILKSKYINMDKAPSLPSPSHSHSSSLSISAETPTMTSFPSLQSSQHQPITNISIDNFVHQVLASTTPITHESNLNDYKYYNHDSYESIQTIDNDDLSRSRLMNKMDHEDVVLTELYELDQVNTKPNLIRPNTISAWDESDIDDLEDEMKQELQAMVNGHSSRSIESGYQSDDEYIMSINNESQRGSNLIQTWCDDWDSEHMELEEDQMKKHLNHLKSKYESSSNSN